MIVSSGREDTLTSDKLETPSITTVYSMREGVPGARHQAQGSKREYAVQMNDVFRKLCVPNPNERLWKSLS
jgi:hypothetical protein